MYVYNGEKIRGSLQIGDNVYPPNFWSQLTAEQQAALGVTEVADPVKPDILLNTVTENPDGTYTAVPVPLATIKALRVDELSTICANSIYAGFESPALGMPHHYPALDKDQSNLAASVLASILPGVDPATWSTPFICADENGTWVHRPHTAAQIQQVGADAKAAIVAAIIKNATLAAQVNAATDVATVLAIVW